MLKVKTPSFLYRHYLYKKILNKILLEKIDPYVLEIGIGSGEFTSYLDKKGLKGEAIDFSTKAIERLKNKIKNINVREYDLFEFKEDKKFDIIFAFEVLEHIQNDKNFIEKIYSLLNDKGIFIFSVPAGSKNFGYGDIQKGHFRRYDKKDIFNLIKETDLKIKKIWNYGFPFLNLIRFLTKNKKKKQDNNIDIETRTKQSGIEEDCNKKWKYIFNNKILCIFFKIMDLFLNTDKGIGYIIIASKEDLI